MNYARLTLQCFLPVIFSLLALKGTAQVTPALVDFDAYEKLVAEVKQHRQSRLLNADEFVKTSEEKNVIILDTRSDSMYAAVHVKGAIHLNFSDFTQANLAKIIPSSDYKILIYCNNNFISSSVILSSPFIPAKDYTPYFATKASGPMDLKLQQTSGSSFGGTRGGSYPAKHAKPITLALNIPTYINLYGYGYRNIYELSELVNTYDNKLEFEGTAVHK